MIDWILNFEFNSQLGLLLYWVPMGLAFYGTGSVVISAYRKDIRDRINYEAGNNSYYSPLLKLGDIIGNVLLSICPVINIWVAITTAFPAFLKLCGKVFDIPLVPKREK